MPVVGPHATAMPRAARPANDSQRSWPHCGPREDEIDEVTEGTRRGFGSVRVRVTVGSTVWATSIFPDAASQSFVLPIKKQVREEEHLKAGEVVDVILELDADAPS